MRLLCLLLTLVIAAPALAQAPPDAPVAAAPEKAVKDNFRDELIKAGQAAKIGPLKMLLLRVGTRNPEILEKVKSTVIAKAVKEGKVKPGAAEKPGFDFSGWAAFLKEIMPMILELIKTLMDLFSQALPESPFDVGETIFCSLVMEPEIACSYDGSCSAGDVRSVCTNCSGKMIAGQPVRNLIKVRHIVRGVRAILRWRPGAIIRARRAGCCG